MPTETPLPLYKCHKTVRALKIQNCGIRADGIYCIDPVDARYASFPVPVEWADRHRPQPGGYFVVYEDGYTSFSPAEAFESGYTEVIAAPPQIAPTMQFPTGVFSPEKLHEMFVYHPPTEQARHLHAMINGEAEQLAVRFNGALPASAETTLAIRALQESRMWANAAVALYVTAGQPTR